MSRYTWRDPDGNYQIDDCMAVHQTLCYDENFQNPFDIYEGAAINKLGEYEDLEEQGLLIKAPCKIGDIIWVVGTKCMADVTPDEECELIDCDKCAYNKECIVFPKVVCKDLFGDLIINKENNYYVWGKTAFATIEEAEAALAAMETN